MKAALRTVGLRFLFIVVFIVSFYAAGIIRSEHNIPPAAISSGPDPAVAAFQQRQTQFAAELEKISAAHHCLPPETWTVYRPLIHQFPREMVVQPVNGAGLPTWDLVVKPWSMDPKVIGGYVKGLCMS